MKRRLALSLVGALFALSALPVAFPTRLRAWQVPPGSTSGPAKNAAAVPGQRKVVKTDAQWRKILTRPQFDVTRHKATEPPFSGKYATSHEPGTFVCVCCGNELFSSKTKFESGTGWPSFWRPIDPRNVENAPDYELGDARIEVMCRDCGAHLGHVFDDGPAPTGLRYCINSLALKLVPPGALKGGDPARAKALSTTKVKSKAKAKATTVETTPAPANEPEAPAPVPAKDAAGDKPGAPAKSSS